MKETVIVVVCCLFLCRCPPLQANGFHSPSAFPFIHSFLSRDHSDLYSIFDSGQQYPLPKSAAEDDTRDIDAGVYQLSRRFGFKYYFIINRDASKEKRTTN
jgi:hypothetical protein